MSGKDGGISPKDESAVALLLERRCQGALLEFLQTDHLITGDLAQSILHFYRVFRQIKDAWTADSIRKIWRRNVPTSQRRTLHGLPEQEISEIVMLTLSRIGTLTRQGLQQYLDDL